MNLSSPQDQDILLKKVHFRHPTPIPPQQRSLPTLRLRKPRRLSNELLRNGQSDHDIQLDGLLTAQELDLLDHLETESTVEFQIERIAAFEVADAVFDIGL